MVGDLIDFVWTISDDGDCTPAVNELWADVETAKGICSGT